jgi:hypothetical protein
VKITVENDRLKATMYRLVNPEAASFEMELKDSFEILARPR